MARHRETEDETPGYDSFLDIVANLVGILVILIMVLGVRAKEAWKHVEDTPIETVAVTQPKNVFPSGVSADGSAPPNRDPAWENDRQFAAASPSDERVDASEPAGPHPSDEAESNGLVLPPLNLDVTDQDAADPAETLAETLAAQPPVSPPLELPDIDTPRRQAEQMRLAAHETETQIATLDNQIAIQKAYRDRLLVAQAAGHEQIRDYQDQLAAAAAQRNAEKQQLAAAQEKLANLQQLVDRVDLSKPEPIVLTHRPSPLAKTVFGREEHFRLNASRISYVPMNDIRDLLKNEMDRKMWKLKETPQVRETVGPIGDFYVRYVLQRSERKIRTEAGPLMRTVVGLDHFELLPVNETMGAPAATALAAGSEFAQRLASYDPSEVTVTIWTYPNSYDDLRQLKEALWQRGFLVAARPLPSGVPIGGSPDGSRSSAE